MHTFLRPTETTLTAERVTVDHCCPQCGADHVKSYRVLGEGGWWDVVKCTECLESLERTRAPRLGVFTPLVRTNDQTEVSDVRR
ncbi:hypothetical protein CA951_33540 [Rhodococcus sp. NCIMB 12038]|nr:hypothetical protein CA951_33540 [Rhodococcus sp. NCIMB 12038]